VADKLFDRHEGWWVRPCARGPAFRVIGVMEKKGDSAFGSQDNVVLIPMTTARTRIVRRGADRWMWSWPRRSIRNPSCWHG